MIFSVFAVVTVIFIIIAATPAGFPYTKAIAPKRYTVIHINRAFHGYGGETIRNESGFHVQSADPRKVNDDLIYKNAYPLSYTHDNCDKELYCGLPVLGAGSRNRIKYSRWTPSGKPNLPETTELKFMAKTFLTPTKVRFEFSLSGADRTVIYISPIPGAEVTDWSFNRTPLDDKYQLPYFIYTAYAMDRRTLKFWIELERDKETWEGPTFRLTVAGHMQHHENYYTEEYRKYLESFPEWSDPWAWIASVESWMF